MSTFQNDEKPFYATIGKHNNATVEYLPVYKYGGSKVTGRLETYDTKILKNCPGEMIILDCRTASDENIIDFILKNTDPAGMINLIDDTKELYNQLDKYCAIAKTYNYSIYTVKEFLEHEKAQIDI